MQAKRPSLITLILPGIQLKGNEDACRSHLGPGSFPDLSWKHPQRATLLTSLLPPSFLRYTMFFHLSQAGSSLLKPRPKLHLLHSATTQAIIPRSK